MNTAVERALAHPAPAALSYELRGLDRWSDVVAALCLLLRHLVPCDSIVWQAVDARRGLVVIDGDPLVGEGQEPSEVLLQLEDHPIVNHYFGSTDGRAGLPVRLSDLISDREFRRTQTWSELYGPLDARRHVSLLTTADAPLVVTSGWSMNRSASDFTDQELGLLRALRPLLTTLELDRRGDVWTPPVDEVDVPPAPTDGPGLSPREVQVLELVASGLTAAAVSRRLGISPHTVRRHLEHVYAKCGHHDRLLAVRWAVERGLIDPRLG